MDKRIRMGVIGCGNMGEAIIRGVIQSHIVENSDLFLFDIDRERLARLKRDFNADIATSTEQLANRCGIILLAVKPQDVSDVLAQVGHALDSSKLVVSIAAGVTIAGIKAHINDEVRVARVMPNIAALAGEGISAIAYDDFATADDKKFVKRLFASVGDTVEIDEKYMDAVTAVSGSGPAYFFYLVEMLEEAASEMGISGETAKRLAFKTAIGSAALLKDTRMNARDLRNSVTSKGGTTEAAFDFFSMHRLGAILKQGINEARERARKLSEGK